MNKDFILPIMMMIVGIMLVSIFSISEHINDKKIEKVDCYDGLVNKIIGLECEHEIELENECSCNMIDFMLYIGLALVALGVIIFGIIIHNKELEHSGDL